MESFCKVRHISCCLLKNGSQLSRDSVQHCLLSGKTSDLADFFPFLEIKFRTFKTAVDSSPLYFLVILLLCQTQLDLFPVLTLVDSSSKRSQVRLCHVCATNARAISTSCQPNQPNSIHLYLLHAYFAYLVISSLFQIVCTDF